MQCIVELVNYVLYRITMLEIWLCISLPKNIVVGGLTVRFRKSPVGVRWAIRCALRPRGCDFPVASGARALSARTRPRSQPTPTQLG